MPKMKADGEIHRAARISVRRKSGDKVRMWTSHSGSVLTIKEAESLVVALTAAIDEAKRYQETEKGQA